MNGWMDGWMDFFSYTFGFACTEHPQFQLRKKIRVMCGLTDSNHSLQTVGNDSFSTVVRKVSEDEG